jgi:protoporphyrinogen oxidase
MKRTVAIIGGGISGISLAQLIKDNFDTRVFEKKSKLGGLISCERIQGFLYHKVGGHVFNSKNKEVLDWFWSFFDKKNEFLHSRRNAQIYIDGKLIPYPIENNIFKLEFEQAKNVIKDLIRLDSNHKSGNLHEFLINNFGKTLYELYFKPYNEKIWNTSLETIPLNWLNNKLPMPDLINILTENILRIEESNMVHSYFYYPKDGGSQFIIDRLSNGIDFELNTDVSKISVLENGEILINDKFKFDSLVFTGNILSLLEILKINNSYLNIKFDKLNFRSNPTTSVLCTCEHNDISWLYIPEKKYLAHRIIYTGNFSKSNNKNDLNSCTVEFAKYLSMEDIESEIRKLPGNMKIIGYNYEPNSYVMQSSETRSIINSLKQELEKYNIFILGRFAEWEYFNMDAAIESAMILKKKYFSS